MPHDNLPYKDSDPVLTLYSHYFLAADLMYSNYFRLLTKRRLRNRLSKNDEINRGIYFCTWLGYLAVTCEGFTKLKMRLLLQENRPKDFQELVPKSDGLGKVMKQHSDPLRKFRNNVFHLRDDASELVQFLTERDLRLEWAEELHTAFADFFSAYRVSCYVHYAIHGRTGEMQK